MLEVAYRDEFAAEPWAVERASNFLRQHKPSSYISLVAALVGAAPDAENIAWARKVIGSTGRLGVLARLIKVAAEPAFIAQAERFVEYWCDTELAPEMICAILQAEPENALARAQGERFLAGIRCREHRLYGTLLNLLSEHERI